MPSSTVALRPPTEARAIPEGSARRIAFTAIALLVLWRAVLAVFDRTELSTDEAQYWFWGQRLEFGAYSKPPLIGWIMRAATELMGQCVWAVRLPAALLHGLTALVLYLAVRRFAGASVAALAALFYLTTPAVALGSALMTTDTPMLLAAAVAMLAQLHLAEARAAGRPSPGPALVLGLALGLGLLAKHAMLFWFAGAALAAAVSPAWRIRRGDALLALAVLAVVIAPHVLWLVRSDFVTLFHVGDITRGEGLSLARAGRFLLDQLLVMGPILVIAMALALMRRDRAGDRGRDRGRVGAGLAALALVPLGIVVGQALQGPVLANWAVLYLLPGTVLAAFWLAGRPWLARVSLLLGLAVSLALPLVKVFGTGLVGPDGRPLLARYLGHAATAGWALETARAAGAATLVATNRDLLADLSWFGAGDAPAIRAVPPEGRPAHHWEMMAPFDPGRDAGPVLLLVREGWAQRCPDRAELSRLRPPPGFADRDLLVIYALPTPACLAPGAAR